MSTRCVIRFTAKGKNYDLYHHNDGYIGRVGKDLIKIIDGMYQHDKVYSEDVINQIIRNGFDDGYEVTTFLHGDIEYLYELDFGDDTGIKPCDIPITVHFIVGEAVNSKHQYKEGKKCNLRTALELQNLTE